MAVIDNNTESKSTTILGMSKLQFFAVSGTVVFLVGFGLYKLFRKK